MEVTQASVKADHVVLTGPITGAVTLEDGSVVDVTQPVVEASDEWHAAQIAHAIGEHWSKDENVHPGQINVTEKGDVEVLPFVYDDSHFKAAKKARNKKSGS